MADVVTIFLPGNRMLMATGFRVEPGMTVKIRWLRGQVRFNSLKVEGNAVGPEGLGRDEFAKRWPNDACYEDPIAMPDAGHAGLWAMVGETAVFVGRERQVVVQHVGEVKVGGNDKLEMFDFPGHNAQQFNKPDQRMGEVEKLGKTLAKVRIEEQEAERSAIKCAGRLNGWASASDWTESLAADGLNDGGDCQRALDGPGHERLLHSQS